MTPVKAAILKTLCYADIFNYPLKKNEIHRWLISPQPVSKKLLFKSLSSTPYISRHQGYYFIKPNKSSVSLRKKHALFSRSKLILANKAANYLKIIPFINLIAVTGALSMNNSHAHDDIDLFIITQKNRLWLTRLLSVIILELFHLRRRPSTPVSDPDRNIINNKICLNLFLDETSLSLSSSRRQLYTAHEVVQIKPLYDKKNTYHQFLFSNSWVRKFLPHALQGLQGLTLKESSEGASNFAWLKAKQKGQTLMDFLNLLAFKLQKKYMTSKITHEQITLHSAFFHPRPTSKIILKAYQDRLKSFNIHD